MKSARIVSLGLLMTAVLLSTPRTSEAFRLSTFWRQTATDGPANILGNPITLTWGIVPEGTISNDGGSSNLISFLDSTFGAGPGGSNFTLRPWFPTFQSAFARWGELSGLTYVYEPNDDGATHSAAPGVVGVRPDVRIMGRTIDGPSNVLAFNSFPDNGDMTIDTSDGAFYSQTLVNFLPLRNVLMHEHGHGLGMNHVESSNRRFLMEPTIDLSFDGPQHDDLLALHRGYGDRLEKSNNGQGNDTAATAYDFGTLGNGMTAEIGTNGRTASIFSAQSDFVSIDDDSDIDFYSFTVNSASTVSLFSEPIGTTYNEGPQGGAQSSFNSAILSNLALGLFSSNGTTLLASDNSGGLGQADRIDNFSLSAGRYFVRVTGTSNAVQLYNLRVSVTSTTLAIDFNGDGSVNCTDIDSLVAEIVAGTNGVTFDLTGDGVVNATDLNQWLADAATNNGFASAYMPGDANLDGMVTTSDFDIWNGHRFTNSAAWCSGDFNADGAIDVSDFHVWNANRGTTLAAVPEPQGWAMALSGLLVFLAIRRPGRR